MFFTHVVLGSSFYIALTTKSPHFNLINLQSIYIKRAAHKSDENYEQMCNTAELCSKLKWFQFQLPVSI